MRKWRLISILLGIILTGTIVVKVAAQTRPGDANSDGRVDGVDYVIWLNHYNQSVLGATNGDFNGSGRVDGVDYVIWLNNYGQSTIISITNISDNRSVYTGSEIPVYEKFEATFQVQNTRATNTFFPFDANPPPGIAPGTGITVNAVFTDPSGTTFTQPAFYFQEFDYRLIGSNEWYYPLSSYKWKVRFSPSRVGSWQYKLVAQDAGGTTSTTQQTFNVTASANKGFIKLAPQDSRYFEFDSGSYFPALGFNMNGGNLNNFNTYQGNKANFQAMGTNGIELTRVWISQFSIFGEMWSKWGSHNPLHQLQEQRTGIVNPVNWQLAFYPALHPPTPPNGKEYYMWLNFDESQGREALFTPCRYMTQIPVKQNTNYRIKVRYNAQNLEGPGNTAQSNFGFAIKTTNSGFAQSTGLCNESTSGTVIAATYNATDNSTDPDNTNWSILKGTFNSGPTDFLPYIYLTFNNVKDTSGDGVGGHVFIDQVWIEEASCPETNSCVNLISKSSMSYHTYISQRDALGFDKVLDLSSQTGVYLKAVMNEKNDRILQTINKDGQFASTQSVENFYGDGRNMTKVRWLQQAWWRYMQARWGYSPYIHSWELLNEGNSSINHWAQADEFGKYMKCRVFEKNQEIVSDPVVGNVCRYDHPNAHLVTTSFSNGEYPWRFWNNSDKLYADVDYADQHKYVDATMPDQFDDSAYYSYWLSTLPNLWGDVTKRKPFIRGEAGYSFNSTPYANWNNSGEDVFAANADGGLWLHNYIWSGINAGGLMEQYFAGGTWTKHLYNIPKTGPFFDHRPMFKTYYNFIKDIPLNNGRYTDAAAVSSDTNLRIWGQKDTTAGNAHVWIANKNHTWKNVVDGVNIVPVSGTVHVAGFTPGQSYIIEWWDTYQTNPATQIVSTQTILARSDGSIVLNVNGITTDTAVKIKKQ